MPATAPPSAKLRPVTSDDYPALAAMLSAFPWEGMTAMPWQERIRHWWDDNPAFTSDWERGWLLDAQGELVGFLGSVPRRVSFDGRVALSANATTWWVAPDHRKSSLQLLARFTAQKAAGHFNTTGSATTNELMEAFGYGPFSPPDNHESFVLVDPGQIVAAKVRSANAGLGLPGGGLLAAAAAAVGPLGGAVEKWRLARAGARDWEELARADERLDGFATSLRGRWRFSAQRDRASIDWYLRGEAAACKTLIACRRGSLFTGLALFLQRDSGSLAGVPILDCIDLACASDEPAIVATLLAGAAAAARRKSIPLVVVRHFDEFIARCCRDFRLLTRVGPPRRDYAKLPPGLGKGDYYLTQFHGDFFV